MSEHEHEDVLDTGTPGRLGLWATIGAAAVLALLGWTLHNSPGELAAIPIPIATSPASETSVTEPAPGPPFPDHVGEFAAADDLHGFLIQYRCGQIRADGSCPRRLLATSDAGRTWESRGPVPSYADSFQALMVASDRELALIDTASFGSLARSIDGGRNWVRLPINRGAPAPVPAGITVLTDFPQACYSTECQAPFAWIDVATQTLHPLPQQPPGGAGRSLRSANTTGDGQFVVSTATVTVGRVAMSVDGARSWTEAVLDIPLDSDDALLDVRAVSAGNGRAYAFVQVQDGTRGATSYGFRTDDAGDTWVGLGLDRQPLTGFDAGVLDGELVTTDSSGRVVVSRDGGTAWTTMYDAPADSWLRQIVPDGPLLLTTFDDPAGERYQLCFDGRTFIAARFPD